jgi:hypothetical protein
LLTKLQAEVTSLVANFKQVQQDYDFLMGKLSSYDNRFDRLEQALNLPPLDLPSPAVSPLQPPPKSVSFGDARPPHPPFDLSPKVQSSSPRPNITRTEYNRLGASQASLQTGIDNILATMQLLIPDPSVDTADLSRQQSN